ncbi:MAG: isochorismate synthase [Thioalkalivibrio sp.]|nr:MAG: isochorismate synthase [Thioalkalivibrio sp.]
MPGPRTRAPSVSASFEAAVSRLLEQVKNWRFREGALLHLRETVPRINLLDWLQVNPHGARCFWQDREQMMSVAGVGAAVELVAHSSHDHAPLLGRINAILEGRDAFFLGGLAFAGDNGRDEWSAFPAARFVLPAIELRQRGLDHHLAVNLLAESPGEFVRMKTHLIELLCRLEFQPQALENAVSPSVAQRIDDMDLSVCRERISDILGDIAQGRLHKVVLARRVELRLTAPVAPFRVLQRWCDTNPGSFGFAMEQANDLFMGCSPERLYRRWDREIRTESLAGTVRRGLTREEDADMERRLRDDPKLVHEHDLVTRFVRSQIAPWVTETDSPSEAGVFKLDRIQHRHLPISATLKPGVLDAQLLHALHPTPAVCGFPRGAAQALIRREETVQRGWYSGAVGIVSPRHSEFAVAIRSALVNQDRILCYSGVGIVDGSDPEAEWNELEAKIESFLSVLGC